MAMNLLKGLKIVGAKYPEAKKPITELLDREGF